MAQPHLAIKNYFRKLRDPRRPGRKRHLLLDIIVITLCGTIAGCNDWQQIETFARARHDWLRKFLRLPAGIPSHDTLERVFDRLERGGHFAAAEVPDRLASLVRDFVTAEVA